MRLFNIVVVALVGAIGLTSLGCSVSDKLGDIGFQKKDNVTQTVTTKYDGLIDADEACNQAWADYEGNLTRRAQMVPQLVGVVKGMSTHEQATLVAVSQAQASATRPEIKLDPKNDDMSDPDKFKAYQQAQSNLGATLQKLMVQAPFQFPQLASTPAFTNLQVQIEGTENRLQHNREQYNAAVRSYNQELRHVSGVAINNVTGKPFKERVYFTAAESDKAAPTVDFGNTGPASTAIVPAAPAKQ